MVISENPSHSHLLCRVQKWSCHYMFLRLKSVAAWIRIPIIRLRDLRSNPLRHGRDPYNIEIKQVQSLPEVTQSGYLSFTIVQSRNCSNNNMVKSFNVNERKSDKMFRFIPGKRNPLYRTIKSSNRELNFIAHFS